MDYLKYWIYSKLMAILKIKEMILMKISYLLDNLHQADYYL